MGILLALYTGMRVGELCALQWDDVADNTIIINKTIQRLKQNGKTVLEITEPKTRSSNRKIPVPDFLMATLNQYRSYGSVLKNRNGKPVEPRLMQLTFEKYVNECGLPKTNFHALRHTFATRCVEAGFDIKSLSEILGHTDVKTTLNKYVHSSLEQKQKNMEESHLAYEDKQDMILGLEAELEKLREQYNSEVDKKNAELAQYFQDEIRVVQEKIESLKESLFSIKEMKVEATNFDRDKASAPIREKQSEFEAIQSESKETLKSIMKTMEEQKRSIRKNNYK